MMTLSDVYCRFNRARGMEVGLQTLKCCIHLIKMSIIGLSFLIRFGNIFNQNCLEKLSDSET